VTFAVDVGEGVRTLDDVSLWEQVSLASFLQSYWADNQVSCTATFSPSEIKEIAPIIKFGSFNLKAISFLPRGDDIYPLMPYQKITQKQYETYMLRTTPLRLDLETEKGWDDVPELMGCENDRCLGE